MNLTLFLLAEQEGRFVRWQLNGKDIIVIGYSDAKSERGFVLSYYRRCARNMNEPTKSGNPPSVEGIVTIPSPFSVTVTLQRIQSPIQSRNMNLFAHIDHSDEAN